VGEPDPEGSSEPFGGREVLDDGAFPVDDVSELEDCELPLSCPLATMRAG
jgi:hypothetical protein